MKKKERWRAGKTKTFGNGILLSEKYELNHEQKEKVEFTAIIMV